MSKDSFLGRLKSTLAHNRLAQALHTFLVVLGMKQDKDLLRRIKPKQKIAPTWSQGDDLSETTGWGDIGITPKPFLYNRNRPMKIMYLNSMGGSMSRLARALMMHEDVDASCYINAFYPRRNMVHGLETNVNGVFTHDEWRDFMKWAVSEFDIIQTTTLPVWDGVAECYDWLSETIGRRHIWRSTGFVHNYLQREDVLPLSVFQADLKTESVPNSAQYAGQTFPVRDNKFQLGDNVMFYSSPEKGVYFEGVHKHWLPSIRLPERFTPAVSKKMSVHDTVKIYVPAHSRAMFKGLDEVLSVLHTMQDKGADIDIITPDNVGEHLPDINGFKHACKHGVSNGAYPIPTHHMASVLQQVDIVVDQIVMGSYGNTGIEAMLCGKPVVGQKNYNEIKDSPIISADSTNFKTVIEDLIENRAQWAALGAASREWALAHHTPRVVAKLAVDVYHETLESSSAQV